MVTGPVLRVRAEEPGKLTMHAQNLLSCIFLEGESTVGLNPSNSGPPQRTCNNQCLLMSIIFIEVGKPQLVSATEESLTDRYPHNSTKNKNSYCRGFEPWLEYYLPEPDIDRATHSSAQSMGKITSN